MVDLFLFFIFTCLVQTAILHVWFDSKLTKGLVSKIREFSNEAKGFNWWWSSLVTCPQCLGFWVALVLTLVNSQVVPIQVFQNSYGYMCVCHSLAVGLTGEWLLSHMPVAMTSYTEDDDELG